MLVLLGGFKVRAQWAALAGLATALLVAILGFAMPAGMAVMAGLHGAFYGLFPIMWIVVNALWIFNMTVATGHFDVLRRSFGAFSADQRTQAILIAFCFGALLEALAGFGAPVAITSVMLVALGFAPMRAAIVALVANTAPVAFGAMAVPIITLAQVTGLPLNQVASMVGRQTPLLAVFVPLVLVFIVDGQARAARGVGARARLRPGVRAGPVRHVELPLGAAHRHRRVAAGRRGRDRAGARAAQRGVGEARARDRGGRGPRHRRAARFARRRPAGLRART